MNMHELAKYWIEALAKAHPGEEWEIYEEDAALIKEALAFWLKCQETDVESNENVRSV